MHWGRWHHIPYTIYHILYIYHMLNQIRNIIPCRIVPWVSPKRVTLRNDFRQGRSRQLALVEIHVESAPPPISMSCKREVGVVSRGLGLVQGMFRDDLYKNYMVASGGALFLLLTCHKAHHRVHHGAGMRLQGCILRQLTRRLHFGRAILKTPC